MRQIALPIFLLLFPLASIAQNEYLANGPIWNETSLCNVGGGAQGNCIATDSYLYFVAGDSLVQGTSWTKVYRSGTVSTNWMGMPPAAPGCSGTVSYPAYLAGLVRQEASQLRIWTDDADQLLYDLDLQVGDTLPLSANNWNTDITVVAKDSILVGSEWRHRFELNNSWALYLVEGIGTSHGLFEPISNFFDCGYELTCFGLGDQAYYPNTGPGCELPMNARAPVALNEGIELFPNPAADRLVITTHAPRTGSSVQLWDARGLLLRTVMITGDRTELDVSSLPPGLYLAGLDGALQRIAISR
jgi:hypothetical protein